MKQVCCALVLAGMTLVFAAAASANLTVGVNDDTGKDPTANTWFYSTMQAEGLKIDTLTVRWDETNPTNIDGATAIDQALVKAKAAGVTIELDLYPLHSAAFTGGQMCAPSSDPQACGNTANIQAFGAWAGSVARRFPGINQFVVMNECNQPLFVNPQWDTSGNNQSAEICGRALAAAYDAIKAFSSLDFVWGVGLSPRGNDNPHATSDSSTTPVSFLADLGAWFKSFAQATGRTAPLMDGFDFHPYPIPQTQPFTQGYANPKEASVTNLARIYQAFYSGFSGSPQKTIGQQAGGGLPVSLNETGIQTDSSSHAAAYTGTEVSATSAGGVTGGFATESYQASWYQQMLNLLACDPNVQFVNIFHLIDETALSGWQSGLYYADQTPKLSAQTVHDWIAQTGGACQGKLQPWTPPGVPAATTATTTTTTTTPATVTQTGCTTTKAACNAYIQSVVKSLKALQKQLKHAPKTQKKALQAQINAKQKALKAAQKALKKLKH